MSPGLSPPVAAKPSVPREVRFAWISPRGTATIADVASAHLTSSYLLHSALTSIELPLNEFSVNNLVAFDVPATYSPKFEQALLKAVSKIRRMGPHVVVFVQPSLRKKTQRSTWVQSWNESSHTPFRFYQTCSCQLGNGAPGCHFVYYLGTSISGEWRMCNEVPTLGATPVATHKSMEAALVTMLNLCGGGGHQALIGRWRVC